MILDQAKSEHAPSSKDWGVQDPRGGIGTTFAQHDSHFTRPNREGINMRQQTNMSRRPAPPPSFSDLEGIGRPHPLTLARAADAGAVVQALLESWEDLI